MRPQAECPRCGALLTKYGCSVCGYGRGEQRDLSNRDVVKPGDKVFINYHDLKHTPAIVRSIQDRKQGIISIRILPKDMPPVHAYMTDPADGMIALVVMGEEWELGRRS